MAGGGLVHEVRMRVEGLGALAAGMGALHVMWRRNSQSNTGGAEQSPAVHGCLQAPPGVGSGCWAAERVVQVRPIRS